MSPSVWVRADLPRIIVLPWESGEPMKHLAFRAPVVAAALLLVGCAPLDVDRNVAEASAMALPVAGAQARLLRSDDERRQARAEVDAALDKPLEVDDAVRIAVVAGLSLQAVLFEGAARSAAATQSARLPNPVFTFDRLLRRHDGEVEKDIGRMLSFSVFDMLLLPARLRAADYQQQQLRLRAAGDVVQAAAEARQGWVRAVAAQQSVVYAEQVKAAADAGAELAQRMQSVGNFSRLQRAREQAFYADAVAQLARAQQASRAAREALVRILGLDAAQAARLRLPDRLPDLPGAPDDETALARTALEQRLDVRMAQADLEYLAREQGLTRVTSVVDGLHLAAVRNSATGQPPQKGYEIEMPLPIFDFGDARRAQAEATYMAALNRAALVGAHATSQVRESYGAYRTAYDIARHYRDEVVPLRKAIADEMLLKYNGMLIGVFELLADARGQIASVAQAIESSRDFWLADAALRASIVGRPLAGVAMEMKSAPAAAGGGAH
jgi:outer membrane protein TolC